MSAGPDLIVTAFKMFSALGIVLGCLLVILYLTKRFLKKDIGGTNDKLIKILANQYVGVKKNISLVQVPGAVLVLGITNDNIRLLTKIEDQSLVNSLSIGEERDPGSFSDQLFKITSRFKSLQSGR